MAEVDIFSLIALITAFLMMVGLIWQETRELDRLEKKIDELRESNIGLATAFQDIVSVLQNDVFNVESKLEDGDRHSEEETLSENNDANETFQLSAKVEMPACHDNAEVAEENTDIIVGDNIQRIHLHDSFDVVWKKGSVDGKCVVRAYDQNGLPTRSLNVSSQYGTVIMVGDNIRLVEVISPSLESVIMSSSANGKVEISTGNHVKKFSIEMAGSGSVCCRDLEIDEKLYVEIKGGGSVEISGSAHSATFFLKDSGNINAYKLDTKVVKAIIHGSGNVICHPTAELDGEVYGSGCIKYCGNPKLSVGGTQVIKIL